MIFYHVLPKVRFFYLGKKKGRQKIYIRHVSSYFFIFLHVSSCFSIFFVCFLCFFMFYLGALVLPLLRGPLPVPPGRSHFPSFFFYPGRGIERPRRRKGPFRGGFEAPERSKTPAHTHCMTLASRIMNSDWKSQIKKSANSKKLEFTFRTLTRARCSSIFRIHRH
jgi:hypothetical protein